MITLICLTITENNPNDAIRVAEAALELDIIDLVEFRLDYFKTKIPSKEDIEVLSDYPCIITIRPYWEGGLYKDHNAKRIELLKTAIEYNTKYIDIELYEPKNKELVDYRNEIGSKTKVIVSYHNFNETPSYKTLVNIVTKELVIGDIAKFATMVNTKRDILTILQTINDFENKVIGIGMGDKGKLTRVLNLYFGSILTYIVFNRRKMSAPGQLDVNELCNLLTVIDYGDGNDQM